MLSAIKSPEDIKKLSHKELSSLALQIRKLIIDTVGKNGGHLASNLGVVELTIALHRVFNSPKDAIIWDVSHQCYTHKILTGRYAEFSTLRQSGGLSGFTKQAESEHDFFDNGHASTSISSALGLLTARSIKGEEGKVIAVIGDGALTGGMALEGLSNAGQIAKDLVVIVNDNQMSIDQNTGAISSYLSRITMTSPYQSFRHTVDSFIQKIPLLNRILTKFVFRFKRGLKGLLLSNNLFTDLGFEYVGPLDGHNIRELEVVLGRVKRMRRPVVVHVITKKGKGYSPAEDHPEKFHGIGPFATSDGLVEKFDSLSFTEAFSNALMELAEKENRIVCITAAMAKGTGLAPFSRKWPERFFDTGIAEEHAVTFAAGLSKGGLIPVVCIYSTFMQRSVDQVIHDIALQRLKCIFVLDRAGAVPNDGETHQGIFDISLFRSVPNLEILSPVSAADLRACLFYAAQADCPVIIRYPKLSCPTELTAFSSSVERGKGIFVRGSDFAPEYEDLYEMQEKTNLGATCGGVKKVLLVTTGGLFSESQKAARSLLFSGVHADLYVLRFIKPFDEEYFVLLAKEYDAVICAEDGIITGGIGSYIESVCLKNGIKNIRCLGFAERFYPQGTRDFILSEAGLDSESIFTAAKGALQ